MRGYQKKVIYVKNTGSDIFEEAYFVVKGDGYDGGYSHEKMVDEANRIINENAPNKKRRFFKSVGVIIPSFFLGVLLCVVVFLLFEAL